MHNKNILFVVRSLNPGGAERQIVNLAKGLKNRGYNVFVAPFCYSDGCFEKDLLESGICVYPLGKRRVWDLLSCFWRLLFIIRHKNPGILHSYLPGSNLVALLFKFLFPGLKIIWGVRSSCRLPKFCSIRINLILKLESFFSCFADHIIINSYAGKDHFVKKGFPAGKVTVVSNGIDTDYFRPDRAAGCAVRSEWGIDKNAKLIGIVGRIEFLKGYDTFIEAASFLARQRKDVMFVCVGNDYERYKIKMLALSCKLGLKNRIIWVGQRNDMPQVYNAFEILSSCSLCEGFSNVVSEAMACGITCVATDVGDTAFIMGGIGKIVQTGQSEELAQAWSDILNLSAQERELLSQRARNRIADEFNLEKLVNKTESIISRIAA